MLFITITSDRDFQELSEYVQHLFLITILTKLFKIFQFRKSEKKAAGRESVKHEDFGKNIKIVFERIPLNGSTFTAILNVPPTTDKYIYKTFHVDYTLEVGDKYNLTLLFENIKSVATLLKTAYVKVYYKYV